MANFSIDPNSIQSPIGQYQEYLKTEIYSLNLANARNDLKNPLILQKMGLLEADGIRKAINVNSVINFDGFQETNASIANSSNHIGNKLGYIADKLTSSPNEDFVALIDNIDDINREISISNTHLYNIHSGINNIDTDIKNLNENVNVIGNKANQHLYEIKRGLNVSNEHLSSLNKNVNNLEKINKKGFNTISNDIHVLRNMTGQWFSNLYTQLSMSKDLLYYLSTESRIPETQKERRGYIEKGVMFLSIALKNGDARYFDDAFDEFNKALAIERKDYFSLFNLGIIYLRSNQHINIPECINAFKEFIHYAQAEVIYNKNKNLKYKIDDAHLFLAEAYYLQQKYVDAISEVEQCVRIKLKAEIMKIKYLSATNENNNEQEAAKILWGLIAKSPYVISEIRKDDDILRNGCIIDLLHKLFKDTIKKANSLLFEIKSTIKGDYRFEQTNDKIREIENLLQKETFLDSYEATILLEKEYNWDSWKGETFSATIIDFEKLRQDTLEKANYLFLKIKEDIKDIYHIKQINNKMDEIEGLIQKETLLDSYEAIHLMEKIHKWQSREGVSFFSIISDFKRNEKEALNKRDRWIQRIKESFLKNHNLSNSDEWDIKYAEPDYIEALVTQDIRRAEEERRSFKLDGEYYYDEPEITIHYLNNKIDELRS